MIKVRLFRPFRCEHFWKALPPTVKSIAVLDRTKEPGSAASRSTRMWLTPWPWRGQAGPARCRVFGGRYGLSSKEFTPAMVKAVFDELAKPNQRTTSPSASTTM